MEPFDGRHLTSKGRTPTLPLPLAPTCRSLQEVWKGRFMVVLSFPRLDLTGDFRGWNCPTLIAN